MLHSEATVAVNRIFPTLYFSFYILLRAELLFFVRMPVLTLEQKESTSWALQTILISVYQPTKNQATSS